MRVLLVLLMLTFSTAPLAAADDAAIPGCERIAEGPDFYYEVCVLSRGCVVSTEQGAKDQPPRRTCVPLPA